jgi:hypothetical protein
MLVLTNHALQGSAVHYSSNSASPVRVSPPGYPIRFSRSGELNIIRYSTALAFALPAPVGVRLGPPLVDKTSYRAGRTIRYHPALRKAIL